MNSATGPDLRVVAPSRTRLAAGAFAVLLVASTALLAWAPPDVLPRAPDLAGTLAGEASLAAVVAVLLWMTRGETPVGPRNPPAVRDPCREAAILLGWMALVVAGGHALGLPTHVASVGLSGSAGHAWAAETGASLMGWAAYYGACGALVPLAAARWRGYGAEDILLGVPDLRRWGPYCFATGVVGVAAFAGAGYLGVPLAGHLVTAAVFGLGTWLPVAVLLQGLLAPRLALTAGSWGAGAVLTGLAYAAYHATEFYLAWGSTWEAAASAAWLVHLAAFGVLKAVTTLQAGSAWIHIFNTHTPHLAEAPAVARVLGL